MMELSPNNQIEDRKPILTADGLVQTSISQETQTSNGVGGQSQLTVDQLDIEILPIIYDIVRWWVFRQLEGNGSGCRPLLPPDSAENITKAVEKDPLETTVKQRESQDCNHKIFELQKRFESAREQIRQLPGIDYNKEEQQQRLELLRNQLKLKQQLIRKFKDTEF